MINPEQIQFSNKAQAARVAELDGALNRPVFISILKVTSVAAILGLAYLISSLSMAQIYILPLAIAAKMVLFLGSLALPILIFIKNYFREIDLAITIPENQNVYEIYEVSDLETIKILSRVNVQNPDFGLFMIKIIKSRRVAFITTEMGANEAFMKSITTGLALSPMLISQILAHALENAITNKQDRLTTADVFYGMLKTSTNFSQALMSIELSEDDFSNIIFWANNFFGKILYPKNIIEKLKIKGSGVAENWSAGYTIFLDRYSFDITNPRYFGGFSVEGREQIIAQMENILSKESKNNCILTGETGTGKTSIVYGFAENVYWSKTLPELTHKRVVALDTVSLLSGSTESGEIAEKLIGVLNDAVRAGNVILFIDDIHTLFSGSETKVGTIEASEIIAPYLQSSSLRIIGVTTTANYQTYIAPHAQIAGNFEKVDVPPTDESQTIRILEDLSLFYGLKYGVRITFNGLKEVYRLAERFVTNKDFPARAVDVLSNVISAAKNAGEKTLDKGAVDKLSEAILNIPVQQASGEEKEKLLRLEEQLHSRVIGQEAAVTAVSDALRRARTQVADNKRPIGSFLFLGPTGVGKTELSKALAWAYFGSPDNMIRMDMSEFQQVGAIERFVGKKIPGSETLEGGDLVKKVREKPFSVVLLDEIEKAHPDILNLFLQVLDEGYLTDGMGAKVNFSNSIIIATSNAGANLIREGVAKGEDIETLKTNLLNQLQSEGIYRPEFLNRFDGTIIFKPLTKEELLKIAGLMFAKTTQDMKDKGYILEIEQPALEKLVEWGYQPEFGARPMRRVFQDKLESMLAKKILEESIKKGQSFTVKLTDLEGVNETSVENASGTV